MRLEHANSTEDRAGVHGWMSVIATLMSSYALALSDCMSVCSQLVVSSSPLHRADMMAPYMPPPCPPSSPSSSLLCTRLRAFSLSCSLAARHHVSESVIVARPWSFPAALRSVLCKRRLLVSTDSKTWLSK